MQKNSEHQTLIMIILVIQSIIIFHFYGRFTLYKKGFHMTSTCFLSFLLFNTCAFFFLNHFISYFRFHLEITDEKGHPISLLCIFRDLASHIQNYTYLLPWFARSLDNWMWPEVHQFMWYLPSVGKVLLPVPCSRPVYPCKAQSVVKRNVISSFLHLSVYF